MKRLDLYLYALILSWQVQMAMRAYAMREDALRLLVPPAPPPFPPAASGERPKSPERRAARNAHSETMRAYHEEIRPRMDQGMRDLRFADQAFIVAVGNIHRYLWPRDNGPDSKAVQAFRKQRGKAMRAFVRVRHEAFGEARQVRNKYEHVEEEIDRCIVNGRGIAIGNFGEGELVTHENFRGSSSSMILSGGWRVQVAPLVAELKRLHAELDSENPKGAFGKLQGLPKRLADRERMDRLVADAERGYLEYLASRDAY